MTAYAYLDNANVLHVAPSEEIALQYAKNGKVVPTDHPAEYGYPTIETVYGTEQVIDENGVAYINGNEKSGQQIATPDFIQSLLNQLA